MYNLTRKLCKSLTESRIKTLTQFTKGRDVKLRNILFLTIASALSMPVTSYINFYWRLYWHRTGLQSSQTLNVANIILGTALKTILAAMIHTKIWL